MFNGEEKNCKGKDKMKDWKNDSQKNKKKKKRTRPDTRLPKSRAGGQGPYLRSLDHLGRSGEVKKVKRIKKVKWGPTDQPTDRPTDRPMDKAGCRVA